MEATKSKQESISEYIKLYELITCIPLGSVEDERLFSALNYVKSKHRNRLEEHLIDALRVKVTYHDLNSYPFNLAIDHQMREVERRGATNLTLAKNKSKGLRTKALTMLLTHFFIGHFFKQQDSLSSQIKIILLIKNYNK